MMHAALHHHHLNATIINYKLMPPAAANTSRRQSHHTTRPDARLTYCCLYHQSNLFTMIDLGDELLVPATGAVDGGLLLRFILTTVYVMKPAIETA